MIRALLIAAGICAVTASVRAQPAAQPSPACVYESQSYTDGALICASRALMLTCAVDGAKATWKPVTDKSLASACSAPAERPRVSEVPRRRHGARHAVRIGEPSAKCFVFNNKRYCE